MLSGVELGLFDEAAEAVRGLVPRDLGTLRCRARRYGMKVWFDTIHPSREHYEAQVLPADLVGGHPALEIGFHAEHPDAARNDEVIASLRATERRWRRTLGREAEIGPFLGRADVWRRISETWTDPDLADPGLPLEIGARLADYVIALEPARRTAATASPPVVDNGAHGGRARRR